MSLLSLIALPLSLEPVSGSGLSDILDRLSLEPGAWICAGSCSLSVKEITGWLISCLKQWPTLPPNLRREYLQSLESRALAPLEQTLIDSLRMREAMAQTPVFNPKQPSVFWILLCALAYGREFRAQALQALA